ncbi:YeeE/YedE thiosulfate transporter family protein [Clostridium butyricum]|uniref:YeeE/YedE thiosulfate transporter family protein n=1 Tax=Clostridium butyricum TaxID=1492 RepID=UPI003D3586D4
MKIILAIILGGFFGFALSYVGATVFKNIIKMLRLEDLSLAKLILFAIGFSSVLLSISSMIGLFDISHLSVKSMNLGVIIGGSIFGIAFGSVGTCPGTCIGAVGSNGIKKAFSTVLGGLFGAFAFSLSYAYLKDLGLFESLNMGKLTLFNVSEKFPSVFNVGFMGMLLVGVLFMIAGYLLPTQIVKE